MQQRFLLQILLLAQHVSGTTMPISWGLCVRFAGCCSILQTGHITLSSTPDQQLENHSTKYHRQQPLYNALELPMMGIVVPETCWASNKIRNKNLLHLVGILFPHINDDARSKSHQTSITCFRRQFLRKMWPIQSAFLIFTVCGMFLSPWLYVTLLHFSHDQSNCSSPAFSSTTFRIPTTFLIRNHFRNNLPKNTNMKDCV